MTHDFEPSGRCIFCGRTRELVELGGDDCLSDDRARLDILRRRRWARYAADMRRKPPPDVPENPVIPPVRTESGVVWNFDQFKEALANSKPDDKWFNLRREIEQLALRPGFDRLMGLDHNTIEELPHQIKVAEQALRPPMSGRAVLADEVGLGKTIEAGIILRELQMRGFARRVLILAPAALVSQWQNELETKFFVDCQTPNDPKDWRGVKVAIASHSRARSPRHAKEILRKKWDLLIVDEAHKAKNQNARLYKLLSDIERDYILLLTATPLQNDLRELYNLVTLVRPGQLGTWRQFRADHVDKSDVRKPKNADAIRDLTARVMIRTRRASVIDSIDIPPRRPIQPEIALTEEEKALYLKTVRFIRKLHREGFHKPTREERTVDARRRTMKTGGGIESLQRIRLCQRLCSSPAALASSLESLSQGEYILPDFRSLARDLARQARAIKSYAKLDLLAEMLGNTTDRVVVFSEHLPTIDVIAKRVAEEGWRPLVFAGDVPRNKRQLRLAEFKRDKRTVFIATRAGTEGLNLQFCNKLVNYELPWNPMAVEQRIGRLHRIGQKKETYIINLAARGTIEDRILQLLDQKIQLFRLVVGELDVILGKFGGSNRLEKQLLDAWTHAQDDDEFEDEFKKIEDAIEESHAEGKHQEEINSTVGVEDAAMRLRKEFSALEVPARVRLAFGTDQLQVARGVDTVRHDLGIHVKDILNMLSNFPQVEIGPHHREYGPTRIITGLTPGYREIVLTVQADKLPMVLIEITGDAVAPVVGGAE